MSTSISGSGPTNPFSGSTSPTGGLSQYTYNFGNTGMDDDSLELSSRKPQSSQSGGGFAKGITDFGKGFLNGGYKAVTSLFSLKGLAVALGSAGLVAATGGAALPFLLAAGVAVGGVQFGSGILSGNMKESGEGFFNAITALAGTKFMPKSLKAVDGTEYHFSKSIVKEGATHVVKADGWMSGTWAKIRSMGGGKLTRFEGDIAQPQQASIFEIGKGKLIALYNKKGTPPSATQVNSVASAEPPVKTTAKEIAKPAEQPAMQKATLTELSEEKSTGQTTETTATADSKVQANAEQKTENTPTEQKADLTTESKLPTAAEQTEKPTAEQKTIPTPNEAVDKIFDNATGRLYTNEAGDCLKSDGAGGFLGKTKSGDLYQFNIKTGERSKFDTSNSKFKALIEGEQVPKELFNINELSKADATVTEATTNSVKTNAEQGTQTNLLGKKSNSGQMVGQLAAMVLTPGSGSEESDKA